MSDLQTNGTDVTPTNLLLASNKVDGTKVASRDGDAMGSVHSFMVNKRTGQATYAVLSLGGFLGLGKSYYPLPFALLSYDHVADGYIVTIDRRLLEGGPSWSNNAPDFNQAYADRVSNYYGQAPVDLSLT
ncbi:MAG: PRC-barrel domain-containing protein [bacterium]|nr:PRC-barrel domain-containing protein [bacterium]